MGRTPVTIEASATGPIDTYTFEPVFVTIEAAGHQRAVRPLSYEWSTRNIVLSLPFILGVPGILLWSKVPTDLHVKLDPEPKAEGY